MVMIIYATRPRSQTELPINQMRWDGGWDGIIELMIDRSRRSPCTWKSANWWKESSQVEGFIYLYYIYILYFCRAQFCIVPQVAGVLSCIYACY